MKLTTKEKIAFFIGILVIIAFLYSLISLAVIFQEQHKLVR